jgi:hypothetical protein
MQRQSALRAQVDDTTDETSDTPHWLSQSVLDEAGALLLRSAVSPHGRDAESAPFRVLILNDHGQLIRFFYVECTSAADALDSARRLAAGRPAEVWRNGELVGRCAPQP